MKKVKANVGNTSRNILYVILATVLILLIPLIAMQFTDEVNWTLSDFIVAGVLLFGAGLIYVLATRNLKNTNHKIAIGIIVLIVLAYIWAELAVGIFTNLGS